MESSMECLVWEIKRQMLSEVDSNVSASAYDTAWLAIIPSLNDENTPMFRGCLDWILLNQKAGGFWGETDQQGLPTIDALTSTLACMLSLKLWNTGYSNIQSGLSFIEDTAETLVKTKHQSSPRWFILTFPAMIELAAEAGLRLVFSQEFRAQLDNIFLQRQNILQMGDVVEKEWRHFPPLISFLEALPSSYYSDIDETVKKHQSQDGSLFQSPSATAKAFMSTRDIVCLKYLRTLVLKFPNGVPGKYPIDRDLIKLCILDHIQGLGVAEYFHKQIHQILTQLYYRSGKNDTTVADTVAAKLFKQALAFRLLRINGHTVSPGSFCWFLEDAELVAYMEENSEVFMSAMYSVYRATDLQFPGETLLEEARSFAFKMLNRHNSHNTNKDHNLFISKGLLNMIKYELSVPWSARLDRLDHRKWIEEHQMGPLFLAKASFYRMSSLDNNKLMQLALLNFEFQRLIYARELEQLRGWSKKWRLSEMGFGREKTVYLYFAIASSSCFPCNSLMRLVFAKAAIIVTVADDFYDMEGSLHELELLTDAVIRWDGEGLKGHSRMIFDALDNFVHDIAAMSNQPGTTLVPNLQHIWRETFMSWMVERRWSLTGYIPSMDEYLATGFTSIAAHTMALPTTDFFGQISSLDHPFEHCSITKLLMAIARLANDIQSYQKEEADGKINVVSLLNRYPNMSMEDSTAYVTRMLEEKKKEFLQHVFMDTDSDMSKSCKKIHLGCMKVFLMFFNSANLFDSEDALLDDINKSIFLPIKPKTISNIEEKKKKKSSDRGSGFYPIRKHERINMLKQLHINNFVQQKLHVQIKLSSSFIGLRM